jgi:hypothetical protein
MSLPAVSMAMTVVSGVVGAIGAIQQGNATAAAAERDAMIAQRNKELADQDRKLAIETSRIDAEDKARSNRRQLASLRATYGSSGLDMTGSMIDVLEDQSIEMALDERRIEYEGQARNRELSVRMDDYQMQSDMSYMEAKNARKASRISALGYLSSAGGQAAYMGAQL